MVKMSIKELYDHITKHLTPEEALMRLLEGHEHTYQQLRFNEGDEIHPTILISMAAFELGWDLAIPDGDGDDELTGMVVGTSEYINELFPDNPPDNPDADEN